LSEESKHFGAEKVKVSYSVSYWFIIIIIISLLFFSFFYDYQEDNLKKKIRNTADF